MQIPEEKTAKLSTQILRFVFLLLSGFAGIMFLLMIIGLEVEGIREKFLSPTISLVLLFLALCAFISFYIARNLWLEIFFGPFARTLVELQAHDIRSAQFFKIAFRHFRRRLFSLWICSAFFILMLGFSLLLCLISGGPWWLKIATVTASLPLGILSWKPCRIGHSGVRIIDTVRNLDRKSQMYCLETMATKVLAFRADPVAIYISRRLRAEDE